MTLSRNKEFNWEGIRVRVSLPSNYNSRPRTAEVLVDGDKAHLIRRRESLSELWALESIAK